MSANREGQEKKSSTKRVFRGSLGVGLMLFLALLWAGCVVIIPWGAGGPEGPQEGQGELIVIPGEVGADEATTLENPTSIEPPTLIEPPIVSEPPAPLEPPLVDASTEPGPPDVLPDTSKPCEIGATRKFYPPNVKGCEVLQGVTTCLGPCREGVEICKEGVWEVLDKALLPTSEVCDAIDNDCDGAVDENLGSLRCGVGGCANVVDACQGGKKGTCTPKAPAKESCGNDQDDDCDGVVNEDCGSCLPSKIATVLPNAHTAPVNAVAFHPVRNIVATGADKVVKVWNFSTNSLLLNLPHKGIVRSISYGPHGKQIAVANELSLLGNKSGLLTIWDDTGAQLKVFQLPAAPTATAFHSNGLQVAVAFRTSVNLYEISTKKLVYSIPSVHTQQINGIAFVSTSTIASCGQDGKVRLWDIGTTTPRRTFNAQPAGISSCAFSSSGRLVTGSPDGTVQVWDIASGQRIGVKTGGGGSVNSVGISPDGVVVAGALNNGQIKVWNAAVGGRLRKTLTANNKATLGVAFSRDGSKLVSGASDGGVRVWTWDTNATPKLLSTSSEGHLVDIWSAIFHPDGKILASQSRSGAVSLWDATTGKRLFLTGGVGGGGTNTLAFSPDGKQLAMGSSSNIVFLDMATKKHLPLKLSLAKEARGLAYRADGKRLAVATRDLKVGVWDPTTGKRLFQLIGHKNLVYSVAYHPGGTLLATGDEAGAVLLWDLTTRKLIHTFKPHDGRVLSLAFSPDGKLLMSASADRFARMWDLNTKTMLGRFSDGTAVWQVSFSPKGRYFALAASWLGAASVWDTTTRKRLKLLRGHTGWVLSATFSSRGRLMATASDDKTIIIWSCE